MSKPSKISQALAGVADELANVRAEIAAKKTEIEMTRGVPHPREDVIARLDQRIAELASKYRPPIEQFVGAEHPQPLLPIAPAAADYFLAWAFPDALKARFVAEIDRALKAEPPGLPQGERAAAIERLQDQLLQLELHEERIVREAAASGFKLARRADADPRAVLAKVAA